MSTRNMIARAAMKQILIFDRTPAAYAGAATKAFAIADACITALGPGAIDHTSASMLCAAVEALSDFKRNGETMDVAGIVADAITIATDLMGLSTEHDFFPGQLSFEAKSSLTTAVAQEVPPSALLTISSDLFGGHLASRNGQLRGLEFEFIGNAGNGATTAQIDILLNQTIVQSILAIPTNGGTHLGGADLLVPVGYGKGQRISAVITPSGVLANALLDILIGVSIESEAS